MGDKKPARVLLLEVLNRAWIEKQALAVHELNIIGHSQNALATELSVMARVGLVVGSYRPGFRYKEWRPAPTVTVKESAPFAGEDLENEKPTHFNNHQGVEDYPANEA